MPGREVVNVCSDGVPLAMLCSFERTGCGSRLGKQELAMACARVCVQRCLVVVQVWQLHMPGRLAVKCGSGQGCVAAAWLGIISSMHT